MRLLHRPAAPAARAVLGCGLAVLGVVAVTPGVASASIAHPTVVQKDPVDFTPNLVQTRAVSAPATYAFEQSGSTMYVGGRFTALENSARTRTFQRSNVAAFNASTGAVLGFAPKVDGAVWAVRAYGGSIYLAGDFAHVNGVARRGVAKLSPSGAVDASFNAGAIDRDVTDMRVVGGRLVVGGNFTGSLKALNPATGADTGYLSLGISGKVSDAPGRTNVYRFAVSPNGQKLVAVGNFNRVDGQARKNAFMVDLGATAGRVALWYYAGFDKECRTEMKTAAYLRDVDFAPDGSYFAVVATGGASVRGDLGETVCDAAARFETGVARPARPTWINYAGGDTLHSVAVTGAAVYVSGHQRWLDNAGGHDTCAPGCVSRPGIGAVDPRTGKALPWNPTKTRAVGGKELYVTPAGLWVGSDGAAFNNEYHRGIALAPL